MACDALSTSSDVWDLLSDYLRSERKAVLALVSSKPYMGKRCTFDTRVCEKFRADKEVVSRAITSSSLCRFSHSSSCAGVALEHASEELRRDRSVALLALKKCRDAWQHVSVHLHEDVEFLRGLTRIDASLLRHVPAATARKEIELHVVRVYGCALQYLDAALRDEIDLVLEAVKQDTRALQWASDRLRADRTLVTEAVITDGIALRWASAPLQRDQSMALLAIRHDRLRLSTYLSRKGLKGHLRGRDLAASFVDWRLWRERDFALQAVTLCPSALKFATEYQTDPGIVMAAMTSQGQAGCSQALTFAAAELKADPGFAGKALAVRSKRVLKSLSRDVKAQLRRSGLCGRRMWRRGVSP